MVRSPRGRAYCFTLNNPSEQEQQAAAAAFTDDGRGVTFLIFGRETGDSGTPHLQGYLEWEKRITIASLKRSALWLERAHLELRRGSQQDAITYCKKDGDFDEFGTRMRAGARTDLESIRTRIDAGTSIQEISQTDFSVFLQYRKGLQAYVELNREPRSWITEVNILWGLSGTGKTRWARASAGDDPVYVYAGTAAANPWFDGYDGHGVVVFDDFRGASTISFDLLLRLLDRYPMDVPVKGGFVRWCPRTIWFTSNTAPATWYSDNECNPLWRRVTSCEHVVDPLYTDIELVDNAEGLELI